MTTGACDNCTTTLRPDAMTIVDHAAVRRKLCLSCASPVIQLVDDLISDGMERLSPQDDDRCANCLGDFFDERPIIVRICAWRRHALCDTCAEPILDILTQLHCG